MGRSDEAWEDVGEQFRKLGSMFRDHFEARGAGEDADADSEGDVNEAVRSFTENLQTAFSAVVDTVTDPDVHDEARQTAGSFFEALGTTFSDLGADMRKQDDEETD